MNDTWIKLYRRIAEHDIMRDPTALQIFIWILVSVDRKTGTYTTGRFRAAELLKMKPRTFHKTLSERVRDRYRLVTLSSDNKKTTISVNNWSKYQSVSDTSSDTKVTPKGHQSDTKQEVRSKNRDSYEQEAHLWLESYRKIRNEPNRKSVSAFLPNFTFWRKTYSLEEMIEAVRRSKYDSFADKAMSPTWLFRTRNKNGECDYIGDLLNIKTSLEKDLEGVTVL